MVIFIDTSAFYAILDSDDANHLLASQVWENLIDRKDILVTNNYVLLETLAIIQRRRGLEAVRSFQKYAVPELIIDWVNEQSHQASTAALLTANRRQLSLVDCTSFETMRRLGIHTAFAFDPHFVEQGFECVPGAGSMSSPEAVDR